METQPPIFSEDSHLLNISLSTDEAKKTTLQQYFDNVDKNEERSVRSDEQEQRLEQAGKAAEKAATESSKSSDEVKKAIADARDKYLKENAESMQNITFHAASTSKLVGELPDVIIFTMPAEQGQAYYPVKLADLELDLRSFCENNDDTDTQFELVGASFNHGQAHYTAIAKREKKWMNLNDDSQPEEVNLVGRIPKYLVYKKIKKGHVKKKE